MRAPITRFLVRQAAYFLAFAGIGLGLWLRATFGELTVDQVAWHLLYADGPAMVMTGVFYIEFAVWVLGLPFLLATLAALLHGWAAPRLGGWQRRTLRGVPAVLGAAAVAVLAFQVSAVSYAAAYFGTDHFAQAYVEPQRVPLVQEKRRNLILIYAESLETGYSDPALFGQDLLAPLHGLGGYSHARYRPAPGATWTIAGMVATQCGVPLKVYAQTDLRADRAFLPGATCLGDVLRSHGYRNVFLGGAPLSFAGKGSFLRGHGYEETWGREEWERAGARRDEFNLWGMYDAPLFDRARGILERLHASGQPYNLTLLTLDTHNPFGFRSRACHQRGAENFEGIVSCGAHQIAEFVEFARARGWLENTVVVVIGDHLAVPNPVYEKLTSGPERGIFNLFVGKDLPPRNTEELLPYDLFPTLLETLGLRVPGDRMGLGYSAVGSREAVRPADPQAWAAAVVRPSARYEQLWQAGSARTPAP